MDEFEPLVQGITDSVTERIFFMQAGEQSYEARVVPANYGVKIAERSDYMVLMKNEVRIYAHYDVHPLTQSILVKAIAKEDITQKEFLQRYVQKFVISEYEPHSLVLLPRHKHKHTGVIYIYFDLDDSERIQDWFRSRPEGSWRMGLGTDDDVQSVEVNVAANLRFMGLSMTGESEDEVRASVDWIRQKLHHNEVEFRLFQKGIFPSGLMGYCNYFGMPDSDERTPGVEAAVEQAMDAALQRILQQRR